jgi:hypothetical protein
LDQVPHKLEVLVDL